MEFFPYIFMVSTLSMTAAILGYFFIVKLSLGLKRINIKDVETQTAISTRDALIWKIKGTVNTGTQTLPVNFQNEVPSQKGPDKSTSEAVSSGQKSSFSVYQAVKDINFLLPIVYAKLTISQKAEKEAIIERVRKYESYLHHLQYMFSIVLT